MKQQITIQNHQFSSVQSTTSPLLHTARALILLSVFVIRHKLSSNWTATECICTVRYNNLQDIRLPRHYTYIDYIDENYFTVTLRRTYTEVRFILITSTLTQDVWRPACWTTQFHTDFWKVRVCWWTGLRFVKYTCTLLIRLNIQYIIRYSVLNRQHGVTIWSPLGALSIPNYDTSLPPTSMSFSVFTVTTIIWSPQGALPIPTCDTSLPPNQYVFQSVYCHYHYMITTRCTSHTNLWPLPPSDQSVYQSVYYCYY